TVHSFEGSDGDTPFAPLIFASDGNLYGTTSSGGVTGSGTVFKIDSHGTLTTIHSLNGQEDGVFAVAGLLEASDGFIYGAAENKGLPNGAGLIFRFKCDLCTRSLCKRCTRVIPSRDPR